VMPVPVPVSDLTHAINYLGWWAATSTGSSGTGDQGGTIRPASA
jgi:hypothetical protein